MHPVEEYQNYNLDRGWVEWVQLWHPQEEGGVELLYNSVKTGSQFFFFWDQTSWRQDAVEKASTQQREPRLSCPGERERNAVMANRVGESICCNSVRSPTPSHTQPFQIKWEVYFSNNCVARRYCCVVEVCLHM